MKLFGSTKKLIHNRKNRENMQGLEVVEVGFVQFNLVDNQYQQKSEVLYTITSNKCSSYLLSVKFGIKQFSVLENLLNCV